MLTRLFVDNYKCLVNFELRFSEVSLLIGRNGSGKSSVLDIMFALRQLLSGEAKITDTDVFPSRTLTRWQSRQLQVLEIEVALKDELPYTYRLEIEHESGTSRACISLERLVCGGKPLFEFKSGEVSLFRDDHSAGPTVSSDWSESSLARVPPRQDNRRLTRFLDFIRRIQICGLYPKSFACESRTEDALLDRDGSNFAAWYRHVSQERQDLMHEYHQTLGEVIEGLLSIRLEKVGTDARAFVAVFEDHDTRFELRLDELSDGQRALIALYALIHISAGQGATLLLDEPDNYVALPEIQPWLTYLADACGDSIPQAVVCSHHPELIDYLGSDRGLLLEREVSGVVTTRKLDDIGDNGGLKLSEIIARGWEQ